MRMLWYKKLILKINFIIFIYFNYYLICVLEIMFFLVLYNNLLILTGNPADVGMERRSWNDERILSDW